jgi:hypothetical protein
MFFTRIGGQGVHQSHVLGWEGEMEGENKKRRTQSCQVYHCGTFVFSECELFCQMYLHKMSVKNRQIYTMADKSIPSFSIRNQDYRTVQGTGAVL